MIICGYAGIGKSYLAHNFPNIIDLESTPFEKDWDKYYKCAKHYSNQGFLVLLSCHKEIREKVIQLPFDERITIFPCIEDKELFRKRYEQRGNNEDFIKLQMDNWEKWTSENNSLLGEHLEYMKSGETLYDTIIRLSKLSPNRFCTYETKEVDLEEAAINYLLHEHISPLNEVFHQADIKVEMQYHKDIENAFKAGFELGLKAKGE